MGTTPPLKGKLSVGDAVEEEIIGYEIDPVTEVPKPVTVKTGEYSEELVKAAQKVYPNKAGKIEMHHIEPKYIGGANDGKLAPLDAAYHQIITNEFRNIRPYGLGPLTEAERLIIMEQVYSKFPLPSGYSYK